MLFPRANVFIDGGGNDFRGVEKYLNRFKTFHKVYVFEPNPIFHNSYDSSGVTLINKAIWTFDGTIPFHISRDKNQVSSSILSGKMSVVDGVLVPFMHDSPINVECIDFSKWLRNTFKHYWDLTIKFDIEGAEYEVLWKMIEDGTIGMVNHLYVEFHADKIPGMKESHDRLINKLESLGVKVKPWD